jgi:hypothetical protein
MKRGTIAALAALAAVALGTGCGGEDAETPVACLGGADGYLAALEAAPGEVRLEGTTPISDCLTEDQPAGDLSDVSQAAITAATELNRELLDRFDEETAIQLGYLVGAVQEGASTTGGIHDDLVIRLDSAARNAGAGGDAALGVEFERAFGQGYGAGQANG